MLDTTGIFQPRAKGSAFLSTKRRAAKSVIEDLHQSGCLRLLFPRCGPALDAVIINTSGGVTGGDRIDLSLTVGQNSAITTTTQACERAYRAQPNETGEIRTQITVEEDANLHWLPQELILFEGCRLRRSLDVSLAKNARALLVEPVIFGRNAMGETLSDAMFRDRITVTRNGVPLYLDGVSLSGDVTAQMVRQGANAMASVIYAAPDAAAHLVPVRAALTAMGGATLLADDLLVVRVLAPDGYLLRKTLTPILERLSRGPLPASWRL